MTREMGAYQKQGLKKWVQLDESEARNDPGVTVVARLGKRGSLVGGKEMGQRCGDVFDNQY